MKNFLTILFLFCAVSAFGQRKPEPVFNSGIFAFDTVKYDKNFKFNDGIYLERNDVYRNLPLPSNRIICDYKTNDTAFLEKVLREKWLLYYDENDVVFRTGMKYCAAYAINGKLIINLGKKGHLHLDSVTNLIIIPKFGILHFTDGEHFPEKEFGEFLNKNDSSLYDDFLKIPKNQRPDSIENFVIRYNAKHPVYFPVYKADDIMKNWDTLLCMNEYEIRKKLYHIVDTLNVNVNVSAVDTVEYYPDFKFNEGIYWTKQDFLRNLPIPYDRVIMPKKGLMRVIEDSGEEIEVADTRWGYCRGGVAYRNGERIEIGSLCKCIEVRITSSYEISNDGINRTSEWVSEEVQDSYLLDYHTGKSFLYDFKNLEDFLEKRDLELYSEFKNLTEREKRKSMDSFVFKYNQKHPLYIPVYE